MRCTACSSGELAVGEWVFGTDSPKTQFVLSISLSSLSAALRQPHTSSPPKVATATSTQPYYSLYSNTPSTSTTSTAQYPATHRTGPSSFQTFPIDNTLDHTATHIEHDRQPYVLNNSSFSSNLPSTDFSPARHSDPSLARVLSDQHSLRLRLKEVESKLAAAAAASSSSTPPSAPSFDLAAQQSIFESILHKQLEPTLRSVVRQLVASQQNQTTTTPTSPTKFQTAIHQPLPTHATTTSSPSSVMPPPSSSSDYDTLFSKLSDLHRRLMSSIHARDIGSITSLTGEWTVVQYVELPKLPSQQQREQLLETIQFFQRQRDQAMQQLQQQQTQPPQQPQPFQQPPQQPSSSHQPFHQSYHQQSQPQQQQSYQQQQQPPQPQPPYPPQPYPLHPDSTLKSEFVAPPPLTPQPPTSHESRNLSSLASMGLPCTLQLYRDLMHRYANDFSQVTVHLMNQPTSAAAFDTMTPTHYVKVEQNRDTIPTSSSSSSSGYPSSYSNHISPKSESPPQHQSHPSHVVDVHPLLILNQCGFRPFEFGCRTSAVNHIKSLLRDRLKVPTSALANEVWHFESRYNASGAQEWRARVSYERFGGEWTDWHLVKTQATEESAQRALRACQKDTQFKNLFLKPLPGPDDPNPISTVRNYLRDRSVWRDRALTENITSNSSLSFDCHLVWGSDEIGFGCGQDKVTAKTNASIDCLRRWQRAIHYIEQASYEELTRFEWLELPK